MARHPKTDSTGNPEFVESLLEVEQALGVEGILGRPTNWHGGSEWIDASADVTPLPSGCDGRRIFVPLSPDDPSGVSELQYQESDGVGEEIELGATEGRILRLEVTRPGMSVAFAVPVRRKPDLNP